MPTLTRFDTPAHLTELSAAGRDGWSRAVDAMVQRFTRFDQFYNPRTEDTPAELAPVIMAWPAFPARVQREEGPGVARWERADGSRSEQDEYCEWSVERANGNIVRVTFTTETPDYWEHVASTDDSLLLGLYREFVSP